MRAVYVGIGHGNDSVVTELALVEVVQNAAAERGDHRLDLRIFQNAVEAHFLYVENFTAERQDRLKSSVPTLFGGSACRVALDDIDFAKFGALVRTVRKFAGERRRFKDSLSAGKLARVPRRVARLLRRDTAENEFARLLRVFLDIGAETLGNALVDERTDKGIVELILDRKSVV